MRLRFPIITNFSGGLDYSSPFRFCFFMRRAWWLHSWVLNSDDYGDDGFSRCGGVRVFGLAFRYVFFVEFLWIARD